MDANRITELLKPFLASYDGAGAVSPGTTPVKLSSEQLNRISTYIDLLLRWNARINLTSVRTPEEIVTRHFGESLFAARHLLPPGDILDQHGSHTPAETPPVSSANPHRIKEAESGTRVVDLGSGAGFPGVPFKIWSPATPVTLIESNHKKVAFLREVIRALTLTAIDVFAGRADDYPQASASLVTLRAVERFENALSIAARIATHGARLALLIGEPQVPTARRLAASFSWRESLHIPASQSRILLIGRRQS
jgi:16S rRNA (guanine527-N7)-methyltransferase